MRSETKARTIAKSASNKKASDIVIIDMRKMPSIGDYFVIASGASTTQVKAISDNIIKDLKEKKVLLKRIEGERDALWILLDYGDVIAHIFYNDTRRFYDLERLWADAPQKRFREARKKVKSRHAKKKP